jgi:hypothetical protein
MAKPGDAVEAGLAQEMGPEQRALDLKNAIGGVHDAATDAKRAEDARYSKEEADALAALDAEKKAQIAKQPGFLGSFLSQLATGHDAEHPHIMTPLEELTKKREILGQLQAERTGREERARTAALSDPNSDLTKTSARALQASGIAVPSGYTASMFNDMKGLKDLTGKQQHEAGELLVQQHQAAEAARHNRNEEGIQRQAAAAAAGTTSKATREKEQVTEKAASEARKEAEDAAADYKGLVAKSGNSPLFGSAAVQQEQALHRLAEAKVKLNAARSGAPPRPNAVEEERGLLPKVGPAALLTRNGTAAEEVDSYLKGLGGHPNAPAVGGLTPDEAAEFAKLHARFGGG